MSSITIPRHKCFSLGDLHDFDKCVFAFFVRHHLQKKYELEEGSENQAIGSLLDLAIKKLHQAKAYNQEPEYLAEALIKAAENEIRETAIKTGANSFYGGTIKFLTPEVVNKAQTVFKNYLEKLKGKLNRSLSSKTFWEYTVTDGEQFKLWGGPDSLELAYEDQIPEVVDYKYFDNPERGKNNLDMDLMPKLYLLLSAQELLDQGFKKARFRVRSWQDPEDDSIYEEFDLDNLPNLLAYFKDKVRRIMTTSSLDFCEKGYCKVCQSDKRSEWLSELHQKGFIPTKSDLPF